MSSLQPYSRLVQVVIGPMEEWRQPGGTNDLAITLNGDGTPHNLRIKFDVHAHQISTATPTVTQVYNLSAGFRAAITRKRGVGIALYAGWNNVGLHLLHTGTLLAAPTKRSGPDLITSLISQSAFGGLSRSIVAQTYAAGATIKSIVIELAKKIPNITVDPKNIRLNDGRRMGSQGWSYAGPVGDALDRLSRVYGFNWRVENKVFYAIPHGEALSTQRVLLDGNDGSLFRIEPMLAGPMQVKAGVSISSLLNPFIKPGSIVEVRSYNNPDLNKAYVVHNLSHSGDTHSPQWETNIESWVQV